MARSFNGTTNDVIADDAHVATNALAWSIALWIKGAGQAGHAVYSEGSSSSSTPFLIVDSDATTAALLRFRVRANLSTQSKTFTTTATVFDSTWHHFCATQTTGNLLATYVDGIADATGSWAPGGMTLNRATIGAVRTSGAASAFFAGALAHLATWHGTTLSSGQVALLAAGALPSTLSPTHYWPLRGVDSPEPDLGSSPLAGTLAGTSTQDTGSGPPVFIAGLFTDPRVARNVLLRR